MPGAPAVLEAEEPRPVVEVEVEEPRPVVEVEEPRPEVEDPMGCTTNVEAAIEPMAWPSPVAPIIGLLSL
jgi:hypothetical protein